MTTPSFTVATITGGRDDHLRNLIRGIEKSDVIPTELVVVYMNQAEELIIDSPIVIKSFHITSETLPLAQARNECVRQATNETIVFLDVDCIPSSTMFAELLQDEAINSSLVMATPHYLDKDVTLNTFEDAYLNDNSSAHAGRSHLTIGYSNEYTAFWSLCFALTKTTFKTIGGFDEGFVGYGGEDTDFALAAQQAGVKFYIHPARCFHQYHAVYKPPVQHVADIVLNSNFFYTKWHTWPMAGWLAHFVELGYIQWNPDSQAAIQVLHSPTKSEQAVFEDTENPY